MNLTFRVLSLVVLLSSVALVSFGQKPQAKTEIVPQKGYQSLKAADSADLKAVLDAAIAAGLSKYPAGTYKEQQLSAAVIDLADAEHPTRADYLGEAQFYPASVVKLFYVAALERQLEDGKITMSPELGRGVRDMIVDSSNEATQYILDVLTGTSSGAELPQKEFDEWQFKRNRVNRYFATMGYTNINVNQKTFCEDAYGIEQQSRKYKGENRNMLTANATARLMAEIVLGRIAGPERTAHALGLLRRDPFAKGEAEDQAHGFTGKMLIDRNMTDAKLWSKAGWTSKARHDVAYVETADGLKFVVAIFTEDHANERELIPAIAGSIIDGMRKLKK